MTDIRMLNGGLQRLLFCHNGKLKVGFLTNIGCLRPEVDCCDVVILDGAVFHVSDDTPRLSKTIKVRERRNDIRWIRVLDEIEHPYELARQRWFHVLWRRIHAAIKIGTKPKKADWQRWGAPSGEPILVVESMKEAIAKGEYNRFTDQDIILYMEYTHKEYKRHT